LLVTNNGITADQFRAWWQEAPTDRRWDVWPSSLTWPGCAFLVSGLLPLASGLLSQFPREPEPANLVRVERTAVRDEYLGSCVCCALDSLRYVCRGCPRRRKLKKRVLTWRFQLR